MLEALSELQDVAELDVLEELLESQGCRRTIRDDIIMVMKLSERNHAEREDILVGARRTKWGLQRETRSKKENDVALRTLTGESATAERDNAYNSQGSAVSSKKRSSGEAV